MVAPPAIWGQSPADSVDLLEKDINDKREITVVLNGFQSLAMDGMGERSEVSGDPKGTYQVMTIQFHPNHLFGLPVNGFTIADHSPLTAKHVLDKIRVLAFHLAFFPRDAQVIGESAKIVINGTFNKQFQIVPSTNSAGVFYAKSSDVH